MTDAKTKNISVAVRILLVLGWTGLCALIWFAWIAGIAQSPDLQGPDNDVAIGMAACMVTGCTGGIWFAGLLTALVIYMLVRRS